MTRRPASARTRPLFPEPANQPRAELSRDDVFRSALGFPTAAQASSSRVRTDDVYHALDVLTAALERNVTSPLERQAGETALETIEAVLAGGGR